MLLLAAYDVGWLDVAVCIALRVQRIQGLQHMTNHLQAQMMKRKFSQSFIVE
jgi:hypothetical protein